jgi:hypothetical protein
MSERKERHHTTPEEIKAALESPYVIVHYSRCMICGRRTPHEWCHGCYEAVMRDEWPELEWANYDMEPEVCKFDDEHCEIVKRFHARKSA